MPDVTVQTISAKASSSTIVLPSVSSATEGVTLFALRHLWGDVVFPQEAVGCSREIPLPPIHWEPCRVTTHGSQSCAKQWYSTHSMRRTKVTLIDKKTGNLRAVQLLLGHAKMDSTVRYLGVELEQAHVPT